MVSNFSTLILLTSILFLPISLVDAVSKPSTCLVTERDALLEFKAILNDPSGLLSSWTSRLDCCRWTGVICDNATKHVIALNLSGADSMGLEGEIGPSLASLARLQHLDLSFNNFNQTTIPNFIGSMQELQHLNLSSSNLSGILPSQLANLSNLHSLDLSNNYFSSNFSNSTTIPNWLANLTSLRRLYLNGNNFHGSIPNSLGTLTSLQELDLSGNSLSGSIPTSFGNLVYLQKLLLFWNSLSGPIPPSLGRLKSLQELDFNVNSLSGTIPSTFAMLASLKKLDLSLNTLSGVIPKQFFSLPYLEELSLNGNHDLGGTIPETLGQLRFLKKLRLEGNGLAGVISETHFLNLTLLKVLTITSSKSLVVRLPSDWMPPFSLDFLAINGCNMGPGFPMWVRRQDMLGTMSLVDVGISGSIPSWIWNFSSALDKFDLTRNNLTGVLPKMSEVSPLLSDLDLSFNQLEGPLTISLDLVPSLISLNISGNKFSGKFELKGGPCILHTLDLRKNNFSGEFPPSLKNCSQMYDFHLGWNNFNGSLPPWMSHGFPELFFLSLRSNHISGTLLNLSISVLDLAGNELTGTIPDSLLCNGKILNLGGNNLSGVIGDPVKCSCSLTSLHLENNFLTGVIPSFIKNCNNMLILDLGNNRLEGSIPDWIPEKLSSLRFLRLRSNAFTGTIPHQLSSMNALQILDLAHNELHGMLPQRFGNLTAMKGTHRRNESFHLQGPLGMYSEESIVVFTKGEALPFDGNLVLVTSIDLSDNNLFGQIPKDVSDLLGLVNLNLSGNRLSGPIPDNISRLLGMETLDLSTNNLSGEIPQSMSKMTSLSHLNLSYNNFFGKIPVGGQFQTFSNKSFVGNLGLCGFPLGSCEDKDGIGGSDDRLWEDKDGHEKLWIYASVVLGFIFGFWIVCGPILFKAKWRYAYFRFVDDIWDATYVAFAVKVKPRVKRLLNLI